MAAWKWNPTERWCWSTTVQLETVESEWVPGCQVPTRATLAITLSHEFGNFHVLCLSLSWVIIKCACILLPRHRKLKNNWRISSSACCCLILRLSRNFSSIKKSFWYTNLYSFFSLYLCPESVNLISRPFSSKDLVHTQLIYMLFQPLAPTFAYCVAAYRNTPKIFPYLYIFNTSWLSLRNGRHPQEPRLDGWVRWHIQCPTPQQDPTWLHLSLLIKPDADRYPANMGTRSSNKQPDAA